jgi:hypothetical protein
VEEEIAKIAKTLAIFWELLVKVRPELGRLEVKERQESRRNSMVGQAVTMYGYAELMRRFLNDVENDSIENAKKLWQTRLKRLVPAETYTRKGFSGDFLSRDNPIWKELGVLQTTKSGSQTVSNTRQTRDQMAAALAERLKL